MGLYVSATRLLDTELIDAGVFVLDGGTHRTKTKDSNPIKQFKLTFRKIFGLSSFIGLGERDRFELSGDDVDEWLNNPSRGKNILLRNLGRDEIVLEDEDDLPNLDEADQPEPHNSQLQLFDMTGVIADASDSDDDVITQPLIDSKSPKCCEASLNEVRDAELETLVLGLGFEKRTVASLERILRFRSQAMIPLRFRRRNALFSKPDSRLGTVSSYAEGALLQGVA